MKKEKYCIFGVCDNNMREINCLGYERIKVPISKFKISKGDFNCVKLVGDISFDFTEDIKNISGYTMFGKNQLFGKINKIGVELRSYDRLNVTVDVTFHDQDMMNEFIFED